MFRALQRLGFREGDFHTGEVFLNYVAGPPNGPPLLFLPGQSVTWEEYVLLLPRLAPRFQLYAVSLRGHGKSTWTPGQYTFANFGRDLTAFLERVVGGPAIVAGNSAGGVLACWLAANAPHLVRALVLEDPPLFRCEWPAIKDTVVYDTFLAMARMAIPGGGGFPRFFATELPRMAKQAQGVLDAKLPPPAARKLLAAWMSLQQTLAPGEPLDLPWLPVHARVFLRGGSQFDGNVSRAFVEGTVGAGFDHAETLARIAQPVLFLHARWRRLEGRLLGALDDDDVARARALVKGPWRYVRMDCGHAIALDAPAREAEELVRWVDEVLR